MRARDSIETEVPDNCILMMELMCNLLMHALVCNDVTFEIGLNIAYTVRPRSGSASRRTVWPDWWP